MSALRTVLTRTEFGALSDADALALLLSTISGPVDESLWHWDGVIPALTMQAVAADPPGDGVTRLTVQQAATCRDILSKMPSGYLTLDALLINGVQLSSPLFQDQVIAMETVEPPDAVLVLNAILALGVPASLPYWQNAGLSEAPVLSDVAAARAAIAAQADMDRAVAAWTTVSNAMAAAMEAGTPMTFAQAVTMFGEG